MIYQEIELFLRWDLAPKIREKFYPDLLKYLDFIIPQLKQGKHTRKNEMEYVGSQYLYLWYLERGDEIFVVLRNEQGRDVIFKVTTTSIYREVEVFVAHSENGFENRLLRDSRVKKTKQGFTLNFTDLKDVRNFVQSYQSEARITNNTDEIIKKVRVNPRLAKMTTKELIDSVIKSAKRSKKPRPAPVFSVKVRPDGKVHASGESRYDFDAELEIFHLINTMLCGVCEECNLPFPKTLMNSEFPKFMEKLKSAVENS